MKLQIFYNQVVRSPYNSLMCFAFLIFALTSHAFAQETSRATCAADSENQTCQDCRAQYTSLEEASIDAICSSPSSVSEPTLTDAENPVSESGAPVNCTFSQCPEGLGDYRACLVLGRSGANGEQIELLQSEYEQLGDLSLETICERLPSFLEDAKALELRFQDFTVANRRQFVGCLNAEIGVAKMTFENWASGDVVVSRLAVRRAYATMIDALDIERRAGASNIFFVGTRASELVEIIQGDLLECE